MKRIAFLSSVLAITAFSQLASAQTETFKEVTANWSLRQPHSSSDAEKAQAALAACEALIQQQIATSSAVLAGSGIQIAYRNVAIVKHLDIKSDTKIDPWTGKSHHNASGTVVCSYYQTITGL